ncbi:MAG: DUF4130 domain-containing protein [Firmicutes bacterium]|nr:DUF4130 domain-containing protein [Bacillota bacterium]
MAAFPGKNASTILTSVLAAETGRHSGWLEDPRARRRFLGVLEYALRAGAPGASYVIAQVIRQALREGLPYVYAKTSPEARQVYQWARAVSRELSRLKGLIRLEPYSGKGRPILIGKAPMRYNLVDLVLAHFARRFPGHRIILDTGRGIYEWNYGVRLVKEEFWEEIGKESRGRNAEQCAGDYYATLWEAYYESQIIKGRLDISRAMRVLPKRYWNWIREGRKLRSFSP